MIRTYCHEESSSGARQGAVDIIVGSAGDSGGGGKQTAVTFSTVTYTHRLVLVLPNQRQT